jgi:hypothetical protein
VAKKVKSPYSAVGGPKTFGGTRGKSTVRTAQGSPKVGKGSSSGKGPLGPRYSGGASQVKKPC